MLLVHVHIAANPDFVSAKKLTVTLPGRTLVPDLVPADRSPFLGELKH
jgi:hypothetical protein